MDDERLFKGTAGDYTRYRLPYPQALCEALVADARAGVGTRAGADGDVGAVADARGTGRLLDLGCGPGRVVLRLAPSFATAMAVDPEPEMIDEGRQIAADLGIVNIDWVVSRAEGLRIPDESIDLVTIGDAFHRLDQRFVAERVRGWLRGNGALALTWQMCPGTSCLSQ